MTRISGNGVKHIDWIFGSALMKRSILPLLSSYLFYHFLLLIFSYQQQQVSTLRVLLFLNIIWMNICHSAYLHSYLPLNYHSTSSHFIYCVFNLIFGWVIGIFFNEILDPIQSNEMNSMEIMILRYTPSLVAILTLFSCGYSSQPLVPQSLIPPSLSLLFRRTLISALKRVTVQLLFFFGLLCLLSVLIGLSSSSFIGVLTVKFFSRGFTLTLILHSVYFFTNAAFSIVMTYPMNFSKLLPSASLSTLLSAITGQPRGSNTAPNTSSNSYYPFHIQYLPSSSPSLPFTSLTPSPSVTYTSSQPQSQLKSATSLIPSLLTSNDFHLKWKNLFSFQNQINSTLFEYLESNYRTLPSDGSVATAAVSSQNWYPNYEPLVLPNLYKIYQIDVNANGISKSPMAWSSLITFLPSVFSSSFFDPIRGVYCSLRQTLALHDLSRITRSSSSSPRKLQLFQSPDSLSTLTHALLTVVNTATLQVSA